MKVLGVGLSIHHSSQLCVSYVDYCKLILSVGCHVRDVTLSHTCHISHWNGWMTEDNNL